MELRGELGLAMLLGGRATKLNWLEFINVRANRWSGGVLLTVALMSGPVTEWDLRRGGRPWKACGEGATDDDPKPIRQSHSWQWIILQRPFITSHQNVRATQRARVSARRSHRKHEAIRHYCQWFSVSTASTQPKNVSPSPCQVCANVDSSSAHTEINWSRRLQKLTRPGSGWYTRTRM